jgi:hypothetical protein
MVAFPQDIEKTGNARIVGRPREEMEIDGKDTQQG